MQNNKYSTMRVVLIFLAIVSVVLAVIHVVRLTGENSNIDDAQTDLSGYGTLTPENDSDQILYDDDNTVEMESIPNGAMTSGSDAASGSDVSAADAQ